jgi:Cdc6-like AAA superfamily ATPase
MEVDTNGGFVVARNGQHADDNRDRDSLMKWLSATDYAPHQDRFLSRRHARTGQWLLETSQFQTWVNTPGKVLFCAGVLGSGKTILTSAVVDHLQSQFQKDLNIGIAFVYCSNRRQQEHTAKDLLASLLQQLCQRIPSLPEAVKALVHQYSDSNKDQPSVEEVCRMLESVIPLYHRVFIMVDGLDECPATDQCRDDLVLQLLNLNAHCGISIFVTSKPVLEGIERFSRAMFRGVDATLEDVEEYLDYHLRSLIFFQRNLELHAEVKKAILAVFDGR